MSAILPPIYPPQEGPVTAWIVVLCLKVIRGRSHCLAFFAVSNKPRRYRAEILTRRWAARWPRCRSYPRISEHAKARLRKGDPITQTDLEELLRMLAQAKRRIDTTMQTDLAKSTETGETGVEPNRSTYWWSQL